MTVTVCLQKPTSSTTEDLPRLEKLVLIPPGQSFSSLKNNISNLCSEIQESLKCKQIMLGLELIETLGFQFILRAFFIDMKMKLKVGETVTLDSLTREYQIKRTHRKLFLALLDRLEHFGFLTKSSNPETDGSQAWTVSKPRPSPSVITARIKHLQTELLEFPECSAEIEFLNHTAANLAAVLQGKMSGLDILFPAENAYEFQFGAQEFYANSQLLETFKTVYITHGVLASARQMVAEGQTRIRILEIGAGTGSTTIPLLQELIAEAEQSLSPFEIHYTFTDISNFFVGKTKQIIEKMFPTVKFEFEVLDIEEGSETQKFFNEKLPYDIVMAADVFHATQYLDDTLKHTREYLRPGGILVLGEVFKSSIFLDISFGLTEGWWRFGDEIRAPNSPLISNTKWEELIKMAGFSDTFSVLSGAYGVVFGLADPSA